MGRIEKTVFISYRRRDWPLAQAIFGDLTKQGYDVFVDYDGIAGGKFETVIFENIRARAHFLVLLSPTALDRCSDPKDWMRREIEAAIDSQRNIVPLMLERFDFSIPAIANQLTGKLTELKDYNGLQITATFFAEAMDRLRTKFLNVRVNAVLYEASVSAQRAATEQKGKVLSKLAGLSDSCPELPWSGEQWARVNQVIQQEASRARIAASFLPLYRPPPSTDFVRDTTISYPALGAGEHRIAIADTDMIKLPTLQVKVYLRRAQIADPEMTSVLTLCRDAANVLARLEDAVIFNGQTAPGGDGKAAPKGNVGHLPRIWEILGGQDNCGLLGPDPAVLKPRRTSVRLDRENDGRHLVAAVSDCIGRLEGNGHFGPFAVVLDRMFFLVAQTPDPDSLVLPQARIIPLLDGGSLLRSLTLPEYKGVVVALGGAPVELVVATDMSLQFLEVTTDPLFVFRVFEKMALRIKHRTAVIALSG